MEEVDKSVKNRLNKSVLGIYAKQPLAGQVKTRLCPPLTAAEAAALYECCLRETVTRMQQLDCELVICYAGEPQWFRETFPNIQLQPQRGADLGAAWPIHSTACCSRAIARQC